MKELKAKKMSELLIAFYKEHKQANGFCYGERYYSDSDEVKVRLETGRRMPFYLRLTKNGELTKVDDQITIRDVYLYEQLQKQGAFSRLVEYLMDEGKCIVHLEAVQPDWLKKRLNASPLWIKQTFIYNINNNNNSEENLIDFNPCYARIVFKKDNKFTLF